jgi:hypothetical protein
MVFMKKSRIFMTVGTLALVVSAIFATKANKKNPNEYVGTLYYGANATSTITKVQTCSGASSVLYSVKSSAPNATVATFVNGLAIGYNGSQYITLYY